MSYTYFVLTFRYISFSLSYGVVVVVVKTTLEKKTVLDFNRIFNNKVFSMRKKTHSWTNLVLIRLLVNRHGHQDAWFYMLNILFTQRV